MIRRIVNAVLWRQPRRPPHGDRSLAMIVSQSEAYLTVESGDTNQTEPIYIERLRSNILGRDPIFSSIAFPQDMYMSRKQCVICRKGPQEYTIEDAESVNGTRVNDIELTPEVGEQVLKDGDEIEAGKTRLVFHLKDTTDGRRSSPFDEASPAAKTPVGVQSSCGPETRSNHA